MLAEVVKMMEAFADVSTSYSSKYQYVCAYLTVIIYLLCIYM